MIAQAIYAALACVGIAAVGTFAGYVVVKIFSWRKKK